MSTNCANLTKEAFNELKTKLKNINSTYNNLTMEEAIAVISQLMTSNNLTQETIMKPENIRMIEGEVSKSRAIKNFEKKKEEENASSTKIGKAEFKVNTKEWKKNTAVDNPKTLFIFADNLQASNTVFGEAIGETIEVKDGVRTNVGGSSALIRTNTNGDINTNAVGLVTKKNAQNEEGRFIGKEGYFQDTDADFDMFVKANERAISRIEELLLSEDSQYTSISMVGELGTEKAALPERFASELKKMLSERLGIETSYVIVGEEKDGTKLYGLKVLPKGKKAKSKDNSSSKENNDTKEKAFKTADKKLELISSLQAKRPTLAQVRVRPQDRSLLSRIYPNIEHRMARVNFISESFSSELTTIISALKKQLENNDSEVAQYYFENLIKGKPEQQRVFALREIKIEGRSLGDIIFSNILKRMNFIIENSQTEEGIRTLANALLEGKLGQLSLDFQEELWSYNIDINSKEAEQEASKRIIHLREEYSKMLQLDEETKAMEVFSSLCREAAMEIEFNENIRLDFKFTPVETEEDIDENTVDIGESSDKKANKEGYMVKYKLLDPSKTLSLEVKALLGSLYKRNPKNTDYCVFTDLGTRVRMDALTAYRIIQEEFSRMTSPDDFELILDETIEMYPWLESLRDTLIYNEENPSAFNESLRNQFYSNMRKAQIPYGMITKNGLFKRLNKSNKSEDILDNIKQNYEGRVVLNQNSIYSDTGETNVDNCIALASLFGIGVKVDTKGLKPAERNAKIISQTPFDFAFKALSNYNRNTGYVDNVINALKILAGTHEGTKSINFEGFLQSVGVDTKSISIDEMFGNIPFMSDEELAEIKSMEQLEAYFSKDQSRRLMNALAGLMTIVSGAKYGQNLINEYQSAYLQIGSAIHLSAEGYTNMTFRHNGTTRGSYAAPDFISNMAGIISNTDNIEKANEWIEQNYGRFDFYKNQNTGEWNNSWLRDFFIQDPVTGEYTYRKEFEYVNMLSFLGNEQENSIQDIEKQDLKLGLFYAFWGTNKDSRGNDFGYYRTPLISDVDVCVLMKGRRYTGENYKRAILKELVGVVYQELDRMSHVITSKGKNDTIDIEYYNSGDKSNGEKFQYFPEFNKSEIFNRIIVKYKELANSRSSTTATEEFERFLMDDLLEPLIKEKCTTFIDSLDDKTKLGIYNTIVSAEKKNKQLLTIDEAIKQKEQEKTDQSGKSNEEKLARVNEALEEFYYNDFFAQSQIQQLVGGDLAYYKNYQDFVKRNKQAYACGEKLFARETDEQGRITGNLIEKVIYMEDEDVMSTTYEQLKTMLHTSNMSEIDKGIVLFALNKYTKITSTDGQSLRTPKSFKKIFRAKGIWTDEMERAFQNITSGNPTASDLTSIWNAIKPFYFGYEAIDNNGRMEKVVTQHKNSEYMITAMFSLLNTALNHSPKLVGLHKFMEANDIDVVHFHSVVKEGYNSPFNLNYNKSKYERLRKENKLIIKGKPFKGEYSEYIEALNKELVNGTITQEQFNNQIDEIGFATADDVITELEEQSKDIEGNTKNIMFKEFPLDDYMVVQPSEDHLIDSEAILGTQIKNIIMADLPEGFRINVPIGDDVYEMNREQAVRFYNSLLVDNMLDAFSAVNKEFSNIETLQSALFEKMRGNPQYGEDVKAALQLNEDKTAFMLPFNSPTLSNKIEALILSTFKNAIQKQKIKGGNAVLVSNFGLSNELKVIYNNNDETQGVQAIEAYMPAMCGTMFKDFLITVGDHQEIDFEKMKKSLGDSGAAELLDVIGYRIPTEDKYSIIPIRIKGFLPISAGSCIMLPADIITMSGTDFDIDKLFLMVKEFKRVDYKPNLANSFIKYLEEAKLSEAESDSLLRAFFSDNEEVNAAIEEGNKKWDDLKKLLHYNKYGYTKEKIEKLKAKNDVFKQFMDTVGYNDRYNEPKYKIMKPSIKEDGRKKLNTEEKLDALSKLSNLSRKDRMAIRNNMIIDIMRQTLADREVSKLMMQPGNFDRVKKASRQQKILHNPEALRRLMESEYMNLGNSIFEVLQAMTFKQLEKFYEENASPVNPLDVNDYVDMQRNLMDGNALIGMFAVNSSNHYKLQFMPPTIAEFAQITIDGITFSSIDNQYSPVNGERIGRINAEFQAASPDNGKDPCLGDIGANTRTASTIGLLGRLGLSPEVIGVLNTCDDYKSMAKEVYDTMKDTTSFGLVKNFDLNINNFVETLVNYRLDPEGFKDSLKNNPEAKMYVANTYKVLYTISSLAKSLNGVSKVSRCDSPNGALPINLPEVIQQQFAVEDFIESSSSISSPIKGLQNLIDTKLDATTMSPEELREAIMSMPIPRLQAAYTLGIKSAISLCSSSFCQFPALTDAVHAGVALLRAQTQRSMTSPYYTPYMRKYIAELTMYLLTGQGSPFSSSDTESMIEKRNYYIHDFPMKFKQFIEAKDSKGKLLHPEVSRLSIIKRMTNASGKGIKFLNVGRLSDRSRKHFVEELESMLCSEDEEVVKFAQDLFMYSYYDNGFQFGHNNFGIFFTTMFMQQMPSFIDSFVRGNASLVNGDFNYTNFTYQFLLNNTKYIPMFKTKKMYVVRDGGELVPTKEGFDMLASGVNKDGEYVTFLRTLDGQVWIKNGRGRDTYYTRFNYNKTQIPYYDMSTDWSELDFSALAGRGAVGRITDKDIEKNKKLQDNTPDGVENIPNEDIDILETIPEEIDDIASQYVELPDDFEGPDVEIPEFIDEDADPDNAIEEAAKADKAQALEDAKVEDIDVDFASKIEDELSEISPTNDPNKLACE